MAQNRLGRVLTADPGFHLMRNPDTLRAPDVAFVSEARWEAIRDLDRFSDVPPDLAVEVGSPSERAAAVRRKVVQYLAHGVRSVWVVDPRGRRMEQHVGSGEVRAYAGDSAVVTDPVLPGFRCALGDLLPKP